MFSLSNFLKKGVKHEKSSQSSLCCLPPPPSLEVNGQSCMCAQMEFSLIQKKTRESSLLFHKLLSTQFNFASGFESFHFAVPVLNLNLSMCNLSRSDLISEFLIPYFMRQWYIYCRNVCHRSAENHNNIFLPDTET